MTPAGVTPVVGRRAELLALARVIATGLAGRPGVAVVVGEPGIGKSTLVAAAATEARRDSVRVVYAMADEHDRAAFGLWREPWARLGGRGPLLDADLAPDEQRWDVLARLSELVERAAPVLVVLEDLHWADALSAWVAARLAPGLAGDAVAVVATTRPDHSDVLLSSLRPTDIVRLDGLDAAEVAELVRALAPGAAVDAAGLRARTGGNPLFVRELVRAPAGTLTPVVGSALDPVLAALDEQTRLVVAALALAGADVPVPVLAAAVELAPADVVAALDSGVRGDVLVRGPFGAVSFRHALLADAALAHLDPEARRDAHRRLADAWAAGGNAGAPVRAAHHRLAAVPAVDVVEAATAGRAVAADLVGAGDLTGAIDLLTAAVAATAVLGPDRLHAELLLDVADVDDSIGEAAVATAAYEAAASATADPELSARALVGATRKVTMWTDDPEHRAALEAAERRLPPGDHPRRVELYGRLAVLALARPELCGESRRWGEEAVAMAHRLGDPRLVATALIDRHLAPLTPDDMAARANGADELLTIAERSGRSELVLMATEWQYGARAGRGDLAGAEEALERLEALSAVMPSPLWRFGALMRRSMLSAAQGNGPRASACIRQAVPLAGRVLPEQEAVGLHVGALTLLGVIFGCADAELGTVIGEAAGVPQRQEIAFFDVRYGCGALLTGDVEEARAVATLWARRPGELLFGFQAPATLAILGHLVAELELDDGAEAVRDALAPFAGHFTLELGFPLSPPVDATLGRLHLLLDDAPGAVRLLRRAVEMCASNGAAALEARCRWQLAGALDRAGDAGTAERERDRARAQADPIGVVLGGPGRPAPAAPPMSGARLVRSDGGWLVESPHGRAEVPDSVGMAQLARILAAAPAEVDATDLAGAQSRVVQRDLGPSLDASAKRAYRQRISELQAEIDEADDHADIERAARARLELDALMTELRRAVGLGGRDPPSGSSAEKARVNVTRTVRRAVEVVAGAAPALGAHLRVSIRTGRTCRYEPEPAAALRWTVEP